MSITFVIVLSVLSAVMGAGVLRLWQEFKAMKQKLAKLQEANDKRHLPYKSAEALEHALAALDVAIEDAQYKKDYLENSRAWVIKARKNES